MESNLVKRLRNIKISVDDFAAYIANYPQISNRWMNHRRCTLAEMKKLQKELEKIQQIASAARVAGTGTAVLGGLATVAGFFLSFSKDLNPLGKELMKYGSTAGSVGGVASATASLAETGFSMKVLDEVKAVLERDEQVTEELLPFFERSKEIENALIKVFNCGLTSDFTDILTIIKEIYPLYEEGGKTWNRVRSYLSSQVKGNFSTRDLLNLDNEELEYLLRNACYKVKEILLEFCNSDSVREATWAIYESFQENPIAFDLSSMSICIAGKVAKTQNALLCSLGCQALKLDIGLLQGMFKTITFALSVVAFLSAFENFKNGRSKYYCVVEEILNCLEEELRIVKENEIRIARLCNKVN